jgi:hypothetical protein
MSRDIDKQRAADFDRLNLKHAPCATCGTPAQAPASMPALVRVTCDGCWEVEHRLRDYLRDGGAKAEQILINALAAAGYQGHITK